MGPVRRHRSLIAWALYAFVLFSALTCALSHGQMTGLQLSGVGGLYCSANDNALPGLDEVAPEPAGGNLISRLDCPLCSGAVIALAALLVFAWLLRSPGRSLRLPDRQAKRSPRYHWPPANPRAP